MQFYALNMPVRSEKTCENTYNHIHVCMCVLNQMK